MKNLKLKLGTRLELKLITKSGDVFNCTYVSQLLDIIDNRNLVIALPIHESRMVFIPIQATIRIMFLHDIYGLIWFKGTVTEKSTKNGLSVLHVKIESEYENIQRRKHFRLDCYLDASYYMIPIDTQYGKEVSNTSTEIILKKAISKNISASGACIVTEEFIDKNCIIHLSLIIPEINIVKAVCKVVRCSELNNSRNKKYELGLLFIKISPQNEDSIVKYIFDQQRMLLSKTLK